MTGSFRKVDCVVFGGGITGAGVARDAALRGLSVLLVDVEDFASGTSHLTSKLIHGGLRYLEHGHFRMVLEGVSERNRLLNHLAPNLVRPLRFVIPVEDQHLSRWLLTTGALRLYDLMGLYNGGRRSAALTEAALSEACPGIHHQGPALTFWDAQTNDARLVMATLRTAEEAGAELLNYARLDVARFDGRMWHMRFTAGEPPVDVQVAARTIVNATGPWASITARQFDADSRSLTWIKGTHLVLDRFPELGNDAIVLRSFVDQRALWVVPWDTRLLLGTTETRYDGDPRDVRATADEIDYLMRSFRCAFPSLGAGPEHIHLAFAGVRPIIRQTVADENALSRHHEIDVDRTRHLVTISGGKLTTFRRMAEQAVDEVVSLLGLPATSRRVRHRLRSEALWPGMVRSTWRDLQTRLTSDARDTDVDETIISHLIRHYGLDAAGIVADMFHNRHTARPLFRGLPYTLAELGYLCRREQVVHLLDLVRRRTPIYFLTPRDLPAILPTILDHVAPILGWTDVRCQHEQEAVMKELNRDCAGVQEHRRKDSNAFPAKAQSDKETVSHSVTPSPAEVR